MSQSQVTDEAVNKFQNPWCLYECKYRTETTCEWTEIGNCPYATGYSNNWKTRSKEVLN